MRWDELTVEAEEQRRLPGYREPAAVRTFDAPEALDVRFYEVRAKSVLNRVPKASRMPFRWTINAYRGCTHACLYCARGDTPILMADGRTKPLGDLDVGDEIYGTVRAGPYRRYAITQVLAHWQTRKQAYRVVLEDGTELVTSGDHRLLSDRGWKYVTGAEQGARRRPQLTLNNELMGTGRFATPPVETTGYRRGYLSGLIRGDGHLGSYAYAREGGEPAEVHQFRLALTDLEALRRARRYLAHLAIATEEFLFKAATARTRPMTAIRTQRRAEVERIREAVRWPWSPSVDWCKGFLAGIFDAEGGCTDALRIHNTDTAIIERTSQSLRRLQFDVVVEDRGLPNGLRSVRLRGGLRERLRFFHTVDPAITRKRSIDGTAIKSDAKLGVVAIEPLGRAIRMFDITTGTGDFIANGVVSHNCFARPTHTYLDFNAGRDFEREIVVKVNAPEVARAELMRPSWKREHVAMGTNTDPYQWVESRYRLMPGIWEALRDSATPCSVLTKSPLLLRDTELMVEVSERAPVAANLSVPTIDEKAWRATEPHTPHPMKRLEAVAELNRAGIPTGVLIAPLMPGINDQPEQVERILELCAEAGAVDVGGIALHLRGEVKDLWFEWLREHRPDLLPRYERLYARGAYAPRAERDRLAALAKPSGRSSPRRGRVGPEGDAAERDPAGERRRPPPAHSPRAQQALF
jgi:DNA repair photolyase